jgi:hypothetical protein
MKHLTVHYSDEEVPNNTTGKKILGGCLSSGRWWTFSASTVRLLFKFFLTNKN